MANTDKDYREFTLDNGLLVALQNTPTQTISGRLRVHHGGLHEKPGEEGLAHFLEHAIMAGGGRKYYPEQAEKIMRSFGYINAFTSPYGTYFPVGMLADDFESYLSLVSDVVFHPRFDEAKVEQERQRVLRETADAKSSPVFQEKREFGEALYGKGSPFTHFTLGKEEVVAKAMPRDLKAFHERGYNPNNMDLILVGGLPENAEELIVRYFAEKTRGSGSKYIFPTKTEIDERVIFHRPAPDLLNHQYPESSSAEFTIAFLAPSADKKESYAVNGLVEVLGGGMDSRLHRKLSQEMGLTYRIGSQYKCGKVGTVFVSGSVQALYSREAFEVIFREIDLLKQELVDEDELSLMNRQTMYLLAKYLQTDEGHISIIESKLDWGLTPELHLQRSATVTSEMVREAANKYFPTKDDKYILELRDPLKQ